MEDGAGFNGAGFNRKWVLKTQGDLEGRVRTFLAEVWKLARLDGMLIPVAVAEDGLPGPQLITELAVLQQASPFIPVMPASSAKVIAHLAAQTAAGRYAATLRACEARALAEYCRHTNISLPNWMIIGVDCLASFPLEDIAWRIQRAGDIEHLTHDILRNARQGGISSDRFRSSCQMCIQPGAPLSDISISIIGLPIKEFALISTGTSTVRSESLANQLAFDQITDGPAPHWLIEQHERVLAATIERHQRVKQSILTELEAGLPGDVEGWIDLLQHCRQAGDENCEACLEACPLYTGQIPQGREAVAEWLASCVACGMCEQACPKHLPLVALIRRISEKIKEPLVTA